MKILDKHPAPWRLDHDQIVDGAIMRVRFRPGTKLRAISDRINGARSRARFIRRGRELDALAPGGYRPKTR